MHKSIMNFDGRDSLVRPIRHKGTPVEHIEVHPGRGFRLVCVDSPEAIRINDAPAGSWCQYQFLSNYRERFLPGVREHITFR